MAENSAEEIFDICDENGRPTGKTVSRSTAHRDGILHRTAHVWITRVQDGRRQILLQKRSMVKDSHPGLYDTSSAGHIPAGDDPLPSALRELKEELGVRAAPEELDFAGTFRIRYGKVFHGRVFRDNEFTFVYVYRGNADADRLILQPGEVDEVRWFDLDTVASEIKVSRARFCVPPEGLKVLCDYLRRMEKSNEADGDFSQKNNPGHDL